MIKFTEKRAEAQYEKISKLSFSQILDLIRSECENPSYSGNLKQGDTVVYADGFIVGRIERQLNALEGGLIDRTVRQLSLFIVSDITESGIDGDYPHMRYWMYQIKFVGDKLFKEVYGRNPQEHNLKAVLDRIERPTIVFNVKTGEKWICDWNHPQFLHGNEYAPPLKHHSGSGAIFQANQIVILNSNILIDNFINWLSVNPFEVKQ